MALEYDVCVVGGGLAGMSVAYYLASSGVSKVLVIEKDERPAGLLRSEVIDGFTFDVGGSHIIFSKSTDLLNEVLRLLDIEYVKHRRNTRILIGDYLVKYPFENGLKDLPPKLRYECLRDAVMTYIKRVKGELKPPRNFLEWLYYVFGNAIVDTYLRPYNEKIWKVELSELTLDWVGGRVPNPPLEDIMKSAVGLETEGYKHQLNFYYPIKGGIEELIKSITRKALSLGVKLSTSEYVEAVSCGSKPNEVRVSTSNNEYRCRCVVYTAPLNKSSEALKDAIGEYANYLGKLRAVPLAVVSIGAKGRAPPYHWIYFPQKDIIFHRAAFMSNYSPLNAPKGAYSIIAEISFRNVSELRSASDTYLVRRVIEGLEYAGFLKGSGVEVTNVTKWDAAYVIYDINRKEVMDELIHICRSRGIFLHGRFGAWEYLNMDAVIDKSKKLSQEVLCYLQCAP